MFVLGNLLNALATVLDFVLGALTIVVVINALLSWVRPDPSSPIVQFLERVSDALCDPIRRLFPTVVSGFDFAPMIAILVLIFTKMFVVETLRGLAVRMG